MKDQGKISSSRSLLLMTSAVAAAVAGGAYFKALTVQNQAQAVQVDLNQFSWMGNVSLGLESSQGLAAPTTVTVARPAIRIRHKHKLAKPAVRVRPVEDEIESSAAAPILVEPVQAPAPAPAPAVESDPHAEMRGLFHSMRGQFYAVLDNRVDAPTAVLVAAAPVQIQTVAVKPVVHARLAMKLKSPVVHRVTTQKKRMATQAVSQPLVFAPAPPAEVKVWAKPDYSELQRLSDLIALGAIPTTEEAGRAALPVVAEVAAPAAVPAPVEKLVTTQASVSWVPSLETARAALAATRGELAAAGPQVTTHTLAQADPVPSRRGMLAMNSQDQSLTTQPQVVEAFAWNEAVSAVALTTMTADGWRIASAPQHWPTLHWNPEGAHDVALPSTNTAQMLAKLANVSIQSGAGMVFGRVPEGWTIEFTGRSEPVVMMGEDRGLRGFAFVNAAPGAATLILRSQQAHDQASVALVVLPGHASYMDLSSVTQRNWSGRVLDASSAEARGLRDVSISVLDQPQSVTVSGKAGHFEGGRVMVVGDYPVMIETTAREGFKHRYRVDPATLEHLELFRMSESQLQGWISQLEGGVSPESGFVVGALPKLIGEVGDGRVFPKVSALLRDRTLEPETYTLNEAGQLTVGRPLEMASPRFVGVQVPEGPVLVEAEDNHQNLLQSQWIVAQPGVVNVVGF